MSPPPPTTNTTPQGHKASPCISSAAHLQGLQADEAGDGEPIDDVLLPGRRPSLPPAGRPAPAAQRVGTVIQTDSRPGSVLGDCRPLGVGGRGRRPALRLGPPPQALPVALGAGAPALPGAWPVHISAYTRAPLTSTYQAL